MAQVDEHLVADRLDALDERLERRLAAARLQVLRADADHHLAPQPFRRHRGTAERDPLALAHVQLEPPVGRSLQPSPERVHGRAAEEAGDEQVGRPLVQRHRRVDLLDHPVVEHHDALPQGHRLDLVVGDVDHRRAQLAVQLRDLGAHRVAQLGIEVGQGLVQQEHRRLAHQRAPQRHALALAAGHRPRQLVEHPLQPQHVGGGLHAARDFGLVVPAQLQPEGQVLGHGHVRVERVVLEHHGDVAVFRRHVVDHAPADGQCAGAYFLQPGHHPQQGGLAAARRPHQDHQLAVGDIETGPVHGDLAVVVDLAHPVEPHVRHRLPHSFRSHRGDRRSGWRRLPPTPRDGRSRIRIQWKHSATQTFSHGTINGSRQRPWKPMPARLHAPGAHSLRACPAPFVQSRHKRGRRPRNPHRNSNQNIAKGD